MVRGIHAACQTIGIPPQHGLLIQHVAKRLDCCIGFRECGDQNVGLIEEHYATKGSRLHAKSCDWGPMAGFVCLDPRLNKDPSKKTAFNKTENENALSGAEEYFDPLGNLDPKVRQALREGRAADLQGVSVIKELLEGGKMLDVHGGNKTWKGRICPIILCKKRIDWLLNKKIINPKVHWVVVSGRTPRKMYVGTAERDGVSVEYRLLSYSKYDLQSRGMLGKKNDVYTDAEYFAIQLRGTASFEQLQGAGSIQGYTIPEWFMEGDWSWLLGMTNPQPTAEDYGFKACVTGDYDLFSVWPRANVYSGHVIRDKTSALGYRLNPGGIDARPVDQLFPDGPLRFGREPERIGNITLRLTEVKDALNRQIAQVYKGGDCVHHSDEAGNPAPHLLKPLVECFPMAFFIPDDPFAYGFAKGDLAGLKQLCTAANRAKYRLDLKPRWLSELGLRRRSYTVG